ncbi:MAG: hypothetical protein A2015_07425 [Spirochaetes bacterium GWF1_31_7]|nr:MAG: hypothetical protein A2Y30_02800 [Spirochaetes bacterium GWE1_32_154]OHD47587.1 MAG: hypothetical protein A2Y29_00245 [Spirochaetes bacterium GWE2_31_10]OHD51248.1 MAG: hypothetical protein A2015_07425 [Spirochaetes bacterium GWF1_31_7]OHD81241.1 MAG: hypothetical protein A2355_03480 [Spirochaetes bacterium RIFOXYB1_FULL_32_8]HBD96144.1 hypothetical protein [Spirochaetia bacterium]
MFYKRCAGCGQYFEVLEENSSIQYCSAECYKEFIRCSVCGNFFIKQGNDNEENFVCSEECMKKYKYDRLARQLSTE